jgi:hypothetical protein
MIKELLDEKALEEYNNEEFKLEIYKSAGMGNPGLKYKGTQRALLSAFAKLVETALTDDVIPAKVMHDVVLYIANDLGKLPEDIKVED